MRLDILRELFLKDVRETLRDRRSLGLMFGIPLLIYPLMTLAVAGVTSSAQRKMKAQPTRLAVVRPEAAPRLMQQIRDPKSETLLLTPQNPRSELAAGKLDAVLVLPPRAEANLLASRDTEIRIRLDRSRNTAGLTRDRIDKLLDDYEEWIIGRRLQARGMPKSIVRPLQTATDDVATGDQRMGRLLAVMLPVILLFTGMLGAFGPALNAITGEREFGTLETLLVTPATKIEILLAKGALVLIACLMTAAINLLSMSLVMWRIVSTIGPSQRAATGGFSLDPGGLLLAFLAAVPTLIFFAGSVMVVVLAARNFREANAYASILFFLPMAPMFVNMMEPKTTTALLLTPMVNTTLIIRDVLTGHGTASAFLLAFASSTLYAGLMLSLASRLFSTEDLVNSAWEPLSLRGLRQGMRRKARLPAVDEALALFALLLLLLIYLSPSFMRWGFVGTVAGNELLLITLPTLLFAWLMRYRFRETFAWRRTTAAELAGAALIGVGILPWVYALASAQEYFWKPNPETARAMMKLLSPALSSQPVFTALAVGLLAGVCEELFFRGPLQTALARRLPAWLALFVGGVLFAALHLDAHGMLVRTLLGMLLGWIVLRGGSLFPAIVLHAVFDAVYLSILAWWIRTHESSPTVDPIAATSRFQAEIAHAWPLWLAGGAALLLLGAWLYISGLRRRESKQIALLEAQPQT